MINNGVLVPNTELGHLEIDGYDAESRASARAREVHDLSWKKSKNHTLKHLTERLKIYSEEKFNFKIIEVPIE